MWSGPLAITELEKLDTILEPYTVVDFTWGSMREETNVLMLAIERWLRDPVMNVVIDEEEKEKTEDKKLRRVRR
jgi:hypothetical protein